MAAAHPGAHIARILLHIRHHIEDAHLKDPDRDADEGGIVDNALAIALVVAGIHDDVFDLEGELAVALETLDAFRHHHGVLAAGDTDSDLVALRDEVILLDALEELMPDRACKLADNAFFVRIRDFHDASPFCTEGIFFGSIYYSTERREMQGGIRNEE